MALSILLLVACAWPVPRPESISKGDYGAVRAYIAALARQEMRKADVTGLSVALVHDQELIWADGFGFADRAHNVPAGADIYSTNSGMPGLVFLRASSLDDLEIFKPQVVVYTKRAATWDFIDPKLPAFETMPPAKGMPPSAS